MTTMKDMQKMKTEELADLVKEKREEVRTSRFTMASRDVKKTRTARKEIARALTELTKRRMNPTA